ncbi:MAG TPA: hypothetical protein PLJ84_02890 [Bacteroidales bacterium]|nr:hypothetical protein [Bacteroidales bacterium]HPT01515.1 hypothetical protein [Bacteroidales bacterium]
MLHARLFRVFCILAAFVVLLGACDPARQKRLEAAKNDSLVAALDSVESGLLTLEKKYHSGKLTYQGYIRQKIVYDKAYENISAQLGGLHKAYELPRWALQLGLIDPRGMMLDSVLSQQTSVDRPDEGFNSVTLVYISSYDTAKMWADSIASVAHLSEVNDYLVKAKKVPAIKAGSNRGITYLNYNLRDNNKEYLISVQAGPEGILTITATNMKQLNEKLSGYKALKERTSLKKQNKKQ